MAKDNHLTDKELENLNSDIQSLENWLKNFKGNTESEEYNFKTRLLRTKISVRDAINTMTNRKI